ncbi:hypothetical protein ACFVY1_27100 [Streptomyces sp. NPDC058293]|uniref:hypothetical protein n=1 Tax=Streptomyces sp. NPDC058293 TaxID=3346429 RepID=UPI0036E3ADC5
MNEPVAWRATAAAASTGSPLPDVPPPPSASPPGSPAKAANLANPGSPAKAANPGSPAKVDEATGGSRRRTSVDPVKALMHRHRELCERAVDALEIAAGLEAHGVTDRTAARFRHRDVFSLAEEMYARVPRDSDIEPESRHAVSGTPRGRRPVWAALALLPGTLGALTLVGLDFTGGRLRLAVGAGGVLAVSAALRAALRRGPLRATAHTGPAIRAWTCWLLAYALLGDGLLSAAVSGGPDEAWAPATAPLLALAFAVAPGAWCAQLFGAVARRRLASSRGLDEFVASVRPLLLAVFALFLCALWTLIGVAAAVLGQDAAYTGAGTLGALLLLARLLTAHGRTHAPAVVLGAATAAEALAVCTVFAGRLPGCGFLAVPVETAVDAWGPGTVPGLACGAAALTLLVHAARTLTRASAHAPTDTTP